MTNIGKVQTLATRRKLSILHTKINKTELIQSGIDYISEWLTNPDKSKPIPTISGYCLKAKISRSYLYELSQSIPELADIIEVINQYQETIALNGGLTSKLNPVFAMFLLKTKHNYIDTPQNLTQINNNQMNISPDLIKTALTMMKEDK